MQWAHLAGLPGGMPHNLVPQRWQHLNLSAPLDSLAKSAPTILCLAMQRTCSILKDCSQNAQWQSYHLCV